MLDAVQRQTPQPRARLVYADRTQRRSKLLHRKSATCAANSGHSPTQLSTLDECRQRCPLGAVVSIGERNTLVFGWRWSVSHEATTSHLLFGSCDRDHPGNAARTKTPTDCCANICHAEPTCRRTARPSPTPSRGSSNERPRKTLLYQTPAEKFAECGCSDRLNRPPLPDVRRYVCNRHPEGEPGLSIVGLHFYPSTMSPRYLICDIETKP